MNLNKIKVTKFAAVILKNYFLPNYFEVEVFAKDPETASFIFAAFYNLEEFELFQIEESIHEEFFRINLN